MRHNIRRTIFQIFQKRFRFEGHTDFFTSGFQNKSIFHHSSQLYAKMIFIRRIEWAFAIFHLTSIMGNPSAEFIDLPIARKCLVLMFLMAHLTPLAIAVEFELDLHAISPAITRHHTFVVYKSGPHLSIEFTTFEFSTPCLRCLYPRSMFTIGFYQQTMPFSTEFNLCLFVVCCQMNEITYMSNQ